MFGVALAQSHSSLHSAKLFALATRVAVPDGHVEQLVAPVASWYVPGKHSRQADAPKTAAYMPGEHDTHAFDPGIAYFPTGHVMHASEELEPLRGFSVPAGQSVHDSELLEAEYMPLAQVLQICEDDETCKDPGGQLDAHVEAPSALRLDFPQGLQFDEASSS